MGLTKHGTRDLPRGHEPPAERSCLPELHEWGPWARDPYRFGWTRECRICWDAEFHYGLTRQVNEALHIATPNDPDDDVGRRF